MQYLCHNTGLYTPTTCHALREKFILALSTLYTKDKDYFQAFEMIISFTFLIVWDLNSPWKLYFESCHCRLLAQIAAYPRIITFQNQLLSDVSESNIRDKSFI